MTRQPAPHFWSLCGVVVKNRVDELAGRDLALQGVEEANKLLMSMALHVLSEHRSFEHVERRKKRGRPWLL